MYTSVSKRIGIVFAAVLCAAAVSAAASAGHAIVGTVDKVDTAAKTIAVKTVDGTVDVLQFTEKTTVTGAKDVAKIASDRVWCVLAPNRPFGMTRAAVPLQSHVRAL